MSTTENSFQKEQKE